MPWTSDGRGTKTDPKVLQQDNPAHKTDQCRWDWAIPAPLAQPGLPALPTAPKSPWIGSLSGGNSARTPWKFVLVRLDLLADQVAKLANQLDWKTSKRQWADKLGAVQLWLSAAALQGPQELALLAVPSSLVVQDHRTKARQGLETSCLKMAPV